VSDLAILGRILPATPPAAMERVRALEAQVRELPQVQIPTDHVIHAGLYARTICIPAGVILTGAEIARATLLVFDGHAAVTIGDTTQELAGRHVLPASAGRKQAFLALADTHLTMLFATHATDVATAEAQFTPEPEALMSRAEGAINTITITGD
jgi:hypothetical protein